MIKVFFSSFSILFLGHINKSFENSQCAVKPNIICVLCDVPHKFSHMCGRDVWGKLQGAFSYENSMEIICFKIENWNKKMTNRTIVYNMFAECNLCFTIFFFPFISLFSVDLYCYAPRF